MTGPWQAREKGGEERETGANLKILSWLMTAPRGGHTKGAPIYTKQLKMGTDPEGIGLICGIRESTVELTRWPFTTTEGRRIRVYILRSPEGFSECSAAFYSIPDVLGLYRKFADLGFRAEGVASTGAGGEKS